MFIQNQRIIKKSEDYDDKVWEKVMQSNLSGAAASKNDKSFKRKNFQNIILVLSTYGLVGPDFSIYKDLSSKKIFMEEIFLTTPASYTTSKSGLLGLAKYL